MGAFFCHQASLDFLAESILRPSYCFVVHLNYLVTVRSLKSYNTAVLCLSVTTGSVPRQQTLSITHCTNRDSSRSLFSDLRRYFGATITFKAGVSRASTRQRSNKQALYQKPMGDRFLTNAWVISTVAARLQHKILTHTPSRRDALI